MPRFQRLIVLWPDRLWQDLRYAVRTMGKSPGFTAVAVFSLALGIGATTAIFRAVYGTLISPYPYVKPDEIWIPSIQDAKNPERSRRGHFMSEYLEVRKLPAFSAVMATSWESMLLTGDLPPEQVEGVLLSGNAQKFLGVPPLLGRPQGQPEATSCRNP